MNDYNTLRKCLICDKTLLPRQKKFCSKKCYGQFLKENPGAPNHFKKGAVPWNKDLKGYLAGKEHWHWQGGKRKHSGGYVETYCPEHPYTRHGGYIYEHRKIAEEVLGRYLRPEERIHHINDKRADNRPENLYLFLNNGEHNRFHWIKRKGEKKKILCSNLP